MIVCDECKSPDHVHQKIRVGFPTYETMKFKKDTAIAVFFGLQGDYCEKCLRRWLTAIGYVHEVAKDFSKETKEKNV